MLIQDAYTRQFQTTDASSRNNPFERESIGDLVQRLSEEGIPVYRPINKSVNTPVHKPECDNIGYLLKGENIEITIAPVHESKPAFPNLPQSPIEYTDGYSCTITFTGTHEDGIIVKRIRRIIDNHYREPIGPPPIEPRFTFRQKSIYTGNAPHMF